MELVRDQQILDMNDLSLNDVRFTDGIIIAMHWENFIDRMD